MALDALDFLGHVELLSNESEFDFEAPGIRLDIEAGDALAQPRFGRFEDGRHPFFDRIGESFNLRATRFEHPGDTLAFAGTHGLYRGHGRVEQLAGCRNQRFGLDLGLADDARPAQDVDRIYLTANAGARGNLPQALAEQGDQWLIELQGRAGIEGTPEMQRAVHLTAFQHAAYLLAKSGFAGAQFIG